MSTARRKWSDEEFKELLAGWNAGEGYDPIAYRLMRKFRRRYTRNMVAGQCRKHGLVRGGGGSRGPGVGWDKVLAKEAEDLQPRWELQPSSERERRRRLVNERREDRQRRIRRALELREAGMSYGAIALRVGLSPKTVRWHCVISGVMPPGTRLLPPPEEPEPVNGRTRISRAEEEEMERLALLGLNPTEIARRVGRVRASVVYHLAMKAARDELEFSD